MVKIFGLKKAGDICIQFASCCFLLQWHTNMQQNLKNSGILRTKHRTADNKKLHFFNFRYTSGQAKHANSVATPVDSTTISSGSHWKLLLRQIDTACLQLVPWTVHRYDILVQTLTKAAEDAGKKGGWNHTLDKLPESDNWWYECEGWIKKWKVSKQLGHESQTEWLFGSLAYIYICMQSYDVS